MNIKKYLNIESLENQKPLGKQRFLEELANTFKRILPRYFIGGPIGMSNTGGLDTRAILACINAHPALYLVILLVGHIEIFGMYA